MTLYSGTILLTELMMLAMIIHVMNYSGFTKDEKVWYIATFGTIMLCAFAEFIAKHFDSRGSGFVLPLTIITVIQFLVAAIFPLILYKVYADYISIALCACLCYIYYNDLIQEDIKAELVANQNRISSMQSQMISGLANLIESRDLETGEHVARTSAYVNNR